MKSEINRVRWRTGNFLLLGALLPCACDVDLYSESGRLGFKDPGLIALYAFPFESGGAIASGSRVCPLFAGSYQQQFGQHVESCFDTSVTGPAHLDGECIEIDAPGTAIWSLDRNASNCVSPVESDRVVFRSVPLDEVRTEEGFAFERFGIEMGEVVDGAEPPDDWITPGGETLLVAAGVMVDLFAMLREKRTGEEVAWGYGRLMVPKGTVEDHAADFKLSVEEGERAEVWITVDEASSPPLIVEGVPVSDLGDLEIVPLCMVGNDDVGDWWFRAMARDRAGRPVRGVPVSWSLEGDGEFRRFFATPINPDYIAMEAPDNVEEDEVLRTIVRATLGEQVAEVELSWTPSSCSEPEEVPEEEELSGRGCTCTSGDTGGNVGWLPLGLFVVLCSRRRRTGRS